MFAFRTITRNEPMTENPMEPGIYLDHLVDKSYIMPYLQVM
jgi:hypothetical protein